ncbi:hypothetical protein EV182_000599, partial [Spiromyces aspiralis]
MPIEIRLSFTPPADKFPSPKSVTVLGTFDKDPEKHWSPIQLQPIGPDSRVFATTISDLEPNTTYTYKYKVDGEWVLDTSALSKPDENGIENNYFITEVSAANESKDKAELDNKGEQSNSDSSAEPIVDAEPKIDSLTLENSKTTDDKKENAPGAGVSAELSVEPAEPAEAAVETEGVEADDKVELKVKPEDQASAVDADTVEPATKPAQEEVVADIQEHAENPAEIRASESNEGPTEAAEKPEPEAQDSVAVQKMVEDASIAPEDSVKLELPTESVVADEVKLEEAVAPVATDMDGLAESKPEDAIADAQERDLPAIEANPQEGPGPSASAEEGNAEPATKHEEPNVDEVAEPSELVEVGPADETHAEGTRTSGSEEPVAAEGEMGAAVKPIPEPVADSAEAEAEEPETVARPEKATEEAKSEGEGAAEPGVQPAAEQGKTVEGDAETAVEPEAEPVDEVKLETTTKPETEPVDEVRFGATTKPETEPVDEVRFRATTEPTIEPPAEAKADGPTAEPVEECKTVEAKDEPAAQPVDELAPEPIEDKHA